MIDSSTPLPKTITERNAPVSMSARGTPIATVQPVVRERLYAV